MVELYSQADALERRFPEIGTHPLLKLTGKIYARWDMKDEDEPRRGERAARGDDECSTTGKRGQEGSNPSSGILDPPSPPRHTKHSPHTRWRIENHPSPPTVAFRQDRSPCAFPSIQRGDASAGGLDGWEYNAEGSLTHRNTTPFLSFDGLFGWSSRLHHVLPKLFITPVAGRIQAKFGVILWHPRLSLYPGRSTLLRRSRRFDMHSPRTEVRFP